MREINQECRGVGFRLKKNNTVVVKLEIKVALHKAFFLAKASVAMRIYNHLAFPYIYSK